MKASVHFGALCEPIGQQLYEQGAHIALPDIELIQRHADGIVLLSIHGILTEAETRRARLRLMKRITAAAHPSLTRDASVPEDPR